MKAGMNPVEKAEANHQVPKNQVGYVFAGDDLNAVRWV
ncbi:MAG: phosphate ABC transporter substrate-binding protein, partial [Moorea sp. SIO3H5]|nr:phosphate ABC transporter substrate-binding protein [Moorena sp. SIO3H5]